MFNSSESGVSRVYSEFASDPEYRDVLEMFADALPERRRELADAFSAGNYEQLRTRAHQIKGAGGGFGFRELSELAAELERACKGPEPDRIAGALGRVLDYMSRISI